MRPGTLSARRQLLNRHPTGTDWGSIRDCADRDATEIYLRDSIGQSGTWASAFVEGIEAIKAPEIHLHINSCGGEMWTGLAIYTAIKQHPARVIAMVDCLAASIASVILQAADQRIMLDGSQMMIHETRGEASGGAAYFQTVAETLESGSDLIARIYADRAGDPGYKPHFRKLMAAETWLTPEDTVTQGLADEVYAPKTRASAESIAAWTKRLVESCEIT